MHDIRVSFVALKYRVMQPVHLALDRPVPLPTIGTLFSTLAGDHATVAADALVKRSDMPPLRYFYLSCSIDLDRFGP